MLKRILPLLFLSTALTCQAQWYRLDVDTQSPADEHIIPATFEGNTPFIRTGFYNDQVEASLSNEWSMSFWYSKNSSTATGTQIPGVWETNHICRFQGDTNVFSRASKYYFSISGINLSGNVKTFGKGTMYQEYDPGTDTNLQTEIARINVDWWSNNVGAQVSQNTEDIATLQAGTNNYTGGTGIEIILAQINLDDPTVDSLALADIAIQDGDTNVTLTGTFIGDGSGLTGVVAAASSLADVLAAGNDGAGLSITNAFFVGDGSGLTNTVAHILADVLALGNDMDGQSMTNGFFVGDGSGVTNTPAHSFQDTMNVGNTATNPIVVGNTNEVNTISGDTAIIGSVSQVVSLAMSPQVLTDHVPGRLYYDRSTAGPTYDMRYGEVKQQIGQEFLKLVYNGSGATILDGYAVCENGTTNVIVGGTPVTIPKIALAGSESRGCRKATGFMTHDIGDGEFGYATLKGSVRGLNTSGMAENDTVYLNTSTNTPNWSNIPGTFNVKMGHCDVSDASIGIIYADIGQWMGDGLTERVTDGLSVERHSVFVTNIAGIVYAEVEAIGGGDITYRFGGADYTLDCTTGAGVGGRARVTLANGTDTDPVRSFIYVVPSTWPACTLTSNTAHPNGSTFGWVAVIIIQSPATTLASGPLSLQRTTDTFSHNGRGALSYERERIRLSGALWGNIGCEATVTENALNDISVAVSSGIIYQLHRQPFPAFADYDEILVLNDPDTAYRSITNLAQITKSADGTTLISKDYLGMRLIGNVASGDDGVSRLFIQLDTFPFLTAAAAEIGPGADNNTMPGALIGGSINIARIVIFLNNPGGDTVLESSSDTRGERLNQTGGGGGGSVQSEYSDANFGVYDNGDATKLMRFEASGITTATTRTYTAPDKDGTLALLSDVTGGATNGNLEAVLNLGNDAAGQSITNAFFVGDGSGLTNLPAQAAASLADTLAAGNDGNGLAITNAFFEGDGSGVTNIPKAGLQASVQTSLGLADTSTQPGDAVTTLDGTAYRILYTDAAGNVSELVFGALGDVLTSAGASAIPTWETPVDLSTNNIMDVSGQGWTITNAPTSDDQVLVANFALTNLYWADQSGSGGSGFPLTTNVSFAGFGATNVGYLTFTTNSSIPAVIDSTKPQVDYYLDLKIERWNGVTNYVIF